MRSLSYWRVVAVTALVGARYTGAHDWGRGAVNNVDLSDDLAHDDQHHRNLAIARPPAEPAMKTCPSLAYLTHDVNKVQELKVFMPLRSRAFSGWPLAISFSHQGDFFYVAGTGVTLTRTEPLGAGEGQNPQFVHKVNSKSGIQSWSVGTETLGAFKYGVALATGPDPKNVDKDILYFANTQEDGATIYRIQDGPGGKADVTPISFDAWTPQDSTQSAYRIMDMTSINGASLAVITSTMIEPPRRFTDRMAGRAAQKIRTLELWTMALPLTKNSVPLKVDITGVPTLAALWNPPPVDPAAQPPQPPKKNTEARLAFDPLANHLIIISEAEMLRMKFNPNLNKLTLVSRHPVTGFARSIQVAPWGEAYMIRATKNTDNGITLATSKSAAPNNSPSELRMAYNPDTQHPRFLNGRRGNGAFDIHPKTGDLWAPYHPWTLDEEPGLGLYAMERFVTVCNAPGVAEQEVMP